MTRGFEFFRRNNTAFARVFALLCGSGGTAALAFVTQFVLARGMPVSEYGQLAALLAVVNLMTPVAGCSMGWFWLQLFGEEGIAAQRWIGATVRISVALSALSVGAIALYVAAAEHLGFGRTLDMTLLLAPVLLGQSLAESTAARLQLEGRDYSLSAWQFVTQFGRLLVVGCAFALGTYTLGAVLTGYALVGFSIAVVSAISVDQVRRGRIELAGHTQTFENRGSAARPTLLNVLRGAAPYGLLTVFYVLEGQAIVSIVEVMLGRESAALYNVAYLSVAAVCLFPNVLYTKFLVAKLFRWWNHDRPMFIAVFHLGVLGQLIMGTIGMLFLMAVARFLVPLLFGSRYLAAVPVLTLLSIAIPVRYVCFSYGSTFFSKDNFSRKVGYMGAAAIVAIGLNVVLLPILGLSGAAISSISGDLTLLLLYLYGIRRHVKDIDVGSTFRLTTIRSSLACVANGPEIS